jgi:hypothetical protein
MNGSVTGKGDNDMPDIIDNHRRRKVTTPINAKKVIVFRGDMMKRNAEGLIACTTFLLNGDTGSQIA